MIWAILKYIPKAIIAILGEVFVWLFGWLIALNYFKAEETEVTGYPSQFPGKLREHLKWRWATTFDDCADAHWYSGRMTLFSIFGWQPFKNLTKERYELSVWYRYCARVLWLYRNPAYGLALNLGFDQRGLNTEVVKDQSVKWDKGYANTTYRRFHNVFGERGFLLEKQVHLGGQWFLELVLGYKVPWGNERKAMIANRIVAKRYPKQPL